jgi:hypothetical protein
MSAVEYSLIFLSIVIGYVVTIIMVGWGKLIKYYDSEKFSFVYLLWTLILFFYLLFMWFWTFSFHIGYLDSYFWFTMLLVRPLLIYFSIEVLVPDKYDEYDYREHFWNTKRKFFTIVSILWLYEICLTILQGGTLSFYFSPSVNSRDIIYILNLPISISLIFIKRQSYVYWVSILSFVLMVLFLGQHMLLQYIYGA